MHIVWLGERAHHDDSLLLFLGHFLSTIGVEIRLADGRAGRGVDALGKECAGLFSRFLSPFVELWVQQGVHVFGRDAQDGFFFRDQTFIRHIHRDLDRGLGGALAVARLEHPQFATLDGELDILHFLVMFFQFGGDVHELVVDLRHLLDQVFDWFGIADAGHHVLALGVEQVITIHFSLTGGWVASEGHAGARVVAHVAEDHGHDVDSRTQVVGDICGAAVIHGTLAVPGFEHSLGCQL